MGEQKWTLRWENYTEGAGDSCDTTQPCTQHSQAPGRTSTTSTRLYPHNTVKILTKLLKFQLLYQQSRQKHSWTCNMGYLHVTHVQTWQSCSRAGWHLKKELWRRCAVCTLAPGSLRSPGVSARPCRHKPSPWSAQRAVLGNWESQNWVSVLCLPAQHGEGPWHTDLSKDKWHQSPLKCPNCIWDRGLRATERSWNVSG